MSDSDYQNDISAYRVWLQERVLKGDKRKWAEVKKDEKYLKKLQRKADKMSDDLDLYDDLLDKVDDFKDRQRKKTLKKAKKEKTCPGAPKKSDAGKRKCGNCGKTGHNKRTCKGQSVEKSCIDLPTNDERVMNLLKQLIAVASK